MKKTIGLKVEESVFDALESYCAKKSLSKQAWLESKLQDHFFLLMELTQVNLVEGENDE